MTSTKTHLVLPAQRRRFDPSYEAVVERTLRVPRVEGPEHPGASSTLALQLDASLLKVGFKLSKELLEHLSSRDPEAVRETGRHVLGAVRRLVGDHVRHNVYFIDFPNNVPETMEFWVECLRDAMGASTVASAEEKFVELAFSIGAINLLTLPKYGRYQHTYEEMLERHDELVPSIKDRVTILELGDSVEEESRRIYFQLAESRVPLGADDLILLGGLAEVHVTDGRQPEAIPVRENRAAINRARLAAGMPLLVDTPVDVLRLAAAASDGDLTLVEQTRFRSFSRAERRVLMAALDVSVEKGYTLGDVPRYRERFKRLGERLHPHEYPQYVGAEAVFAVARRERVARSLAGRVDEAIAAGQLDHAIGLLGRAPGLLIRNVDYLLRLAVADESHKAYEQRLFAAVHIAAQSTSTRVLLSLREHLLNRSTPDSARVFVNRRGRAWVRPDERPPLPAELTDRLAEIIDHAVSDRLPPGLITVDPFAERVALPISEKTKPGGLGVLPRGSVVPTADYVRFFVYWKERERRTDYDLSVQLLDEDFRRIGQVSFTNLSALGAVHSGDITESQNGATEFIDVDLDKTGAAYVLPEVYVYSGEGFDEVEEVFFGFMERDLIQLGHPFEPRTVRTKSDLFGAGRVATPLAFRRGALGWEAKWLHLTMRGRDNYNRLEENRVSGSLLARAIVEREYLTLRYLANLPDVRTEEDSPSIYLGLDRPEDLPPGTVVYTPTNLSELIQ